jgi:hypothetical protein
LYGFIKENHGYLVLIVIGKSLLSKQLNRDAVGRRKANPLKNTKRKHEN